MNSIRSNISFVGNLAGHLLQGRTKEARAEALNKYLNLLKRFYAWKGHQGVKVVDEPWDYLIILDACRYDDFARLNSLEGRLQKKVSQATHTNEWLRRNFTGYYPDIVYISGNPHCSDHLLSEFKGIDHFYKVENVWEYGWDKSLDTVPPHQITQAALKMLRQYPAKRLIIHYIQPHGPWIGKTKVVTLDESTGNNQWLGQLKTWQMAREGDIDLKMLRQAALDNLELVLTEVEKLVQELSGKIVISADHGEAFGEKWVYSHPPGIYIKELVEVPWLVIDKGKVNHQSRPEALPAEAVVEENEMSAEEKAEIEERLKALGYLE